MKIVIIHDNGIEEPVDQFILIKINGVPGECTQTECISNVKSSLYRSQILYDHANWESKK